MVCLFFYFGRCFSRGPDLRRPTALIELKKKWEEDKAKIEKLKVSRRFRPY